MRADEDRTVIVGGACWDLQGIYSVGLDLGVEEYVRVLFMIISYIIHTCTFYVSKSLGKDM